MTYRIARMLLLALASALLTAPAAFAQSKAPDAAATSVLLDTAQLLQARERGAIIWDTRAAALYRQGHIPGAVNIGDVGAVLRDENSEDYIAQPRIEKILGSAGIDPQREVVVYGAKASPYVYFALLTLQYFNAQAPKIYHGGIEDWQASGQGVSTEDSKLPSVALKLNARPELLVDTAEVVRRLRDPSLQIVDARTPEEFRGEDIRALRGGHIPGAVAVHYMDNWVDPDARSKLDRKQISSAEGLNLKPREQLQTLYAKLDPNKETIVYCQSGVRAAETATVLSELGFKNVRVYDSSWIGYGNTLDAPVEDVTYFNLGNLQAKLNAMQKRIDSLEKELATKASKAAH